MYLLLAWLPTLVTAAAGIGLLAYGPIAQPQAYHAFADTRTILGVANGANVLSNLAFALVGLYGLVRLWPARRDPAVAAAWPGHFVFLLGLVLTAAGSAYYHDAPDNARLVWDRLPMTLVCAGLLAAVRADTGYAASATRDVLVLSIAGIASVVWWHLTEQWGEGDLRPYLLFQALPILLIPLWQLRGNSTQGDRRAYLLAFGVYMLAKLAEFTDRALFDLLSVSGHTIKHLLAAAATGVIAAHLVRRVDAARG